MIRSNLSQYGLAQIYRYVYKQFESRSDVAERGDLCRLRFVRGDAHFNMYNYTSPREREASAIWCDEWYWVCPVVCQSARVTRNTMHTAELHQIVVHVARPRPSPSWAALCTIRYVLPVSWMPSCVSLSGTRIRQACLAAEIPPKFCSKIKSSTWSSWVAHHGPSLLSVISLFNRNGDVETRDPH